MARAPIRLLCAIVLLIHFATAAGTIFGADGAKRFNVARGLMARGRADIEAIDRVPIGVDGRKYAQYAIGMSLAMVPPLVVAKAVAALAPSLDQPLTEFAASMVNVAATVLLVGFLAVFATRLGFSMRTAVALGLVYAFGTMAWQQGKDSFEHPLVALYFTILLYNLHRFAETRQRRSLVWAGVGLGLALLTRYTAVLGFGGAGAFLLALAIRDTSPHRVRELFISSLVLVAATLPFVAFDLWFNYARFGSPFETGHAQLHGNLVVPGSFAGGLFALTLHWETGVLVFNPVLLLGLWGLPRFYRRHRTLALAIVALVACHVAFYASTPPFLRDGGWNWGPRFFEDVMPAMVLLSAPALEALAALPKSSAVRWAAASLVAVSVLIQVESVLVNSNRNFTKKAAHLDGYSYDAHGLRDSLITMQARSVWEISRNLWNGRGPSLERPVYAEQAGATLIDSSQTYGTFQFWWVYAVTFGVAKGLIAAYLAVTLLLLVMAMARLRRALAAVVHSHAPPLLVCPCT